jgi:transposase InsO family protein
MEEARLETLDYIEGYDNRIRRHSSLGYQDLTPYAVRVAEFIYE